MKIYRFTIYIAISLMLTLTSCSEDTPPLDVVNTDIGSVTIKIDGEDDYVIPGCDLRIDTIVGWGSGLDTTFIEVYYFSTTDLFENNSAIVGEEVFYEIELYRRFVPTTDHPTIPNFAPPIGPNVDPVVSNGAPVYFDFNVTDHTEIANDDTQATFILETTWISGSAQGQSTFKRFQDGVEESLLATVEVDVVK